MIVLVGFNELRRGSEKIVKIPFFIFSLFSQVFKNLPKNYGLSLGTDRADITVSSLKLLMKSVSSMVLFNAHYCIIKPINY